MSTQPIELTTVVPPIGASRPRYLMCPPTLYDVDYVINPWMAGNVRTSSRQRAIEQWRDLHRELAAIADIELITPKQGWPDMVFTANAGLAHNLTVVLSRFFHPERQGEERHFRNWFQSAGYHLIELTRDTPFEGEGDALFSIDGTRLWAAHGPRSVSASHSNLEQFLKIEVTTLNLIDPRFYHLDTCFAPLADGSVVYYPPAFDQASLAKIDGFYPPAKRIIVSEEDAIRFACNAINIEDTIILNSISDELSSHLEARGFTVIQIPFSEFLKAGGAAKCLVMRLGGPQLQ